MSGLLRGLFCSAVGVCCFSWEKSVFFWKMPVLQAFLALLPQGCWALSEPCSPALPGVLRLGTGIGSSNKLRPRSLVCSWSADTGRQYFLSQTLSGSRG